MPRSNPSQLSNHSLLWVTDPWSTLDHSQDTTLRLAHEAYKMGFDSYWSASDFILSSQAQSLEVCRVTDAQMNSERTLLDPSRVHHLHYRIDPPVDFNYISLLTQLTQRGISPKQILNPPDLIAHHSEKLPFSDLMHLAPLHHIVKSKDDLKEAFLNLRNESKVISKPLHLAQSIGVKQWTMPTSQKDFDAVLEVETEGFKTPLMLEEYLAGIHEGEVRMWFSGGTFIAALKKFPKAGDFRVLIDEGSKIEAYHLSSKEQEVAAEVGTSLKRAGIGLAAIDFIDSKISDFNITSPGLLVQLEKVHGNQNFAKKILEALY